MSTKINEGRILSMFILDEIQKAFHALNITVFDKVFEIIRDFFEHFEVK